MSGYHNGISCNLHEVLNITLSLPCWRKRRVPPAAGWQNHICI